MKNLILILFFALCLTATMQAQNQTVDIELTYDQSYSEFTGASVDTFGIADSVWTFTILKRTTKDLKPYVYLALDSIGGTAAIVNGTLSSKVFNVEDYTTRESFSWVNGADTIIIFESDTAHHSQLWKLELEEQNNIFKIQVDNYNVHLNMEDN